MNKILFAALFAQKRRRFCGKDTKKTPQSKHLRFKKYIETLKKAYLHKFFITKFIFLNNMCNFVVKTIHYRKRM